MSKCRALFQRLQAEKHHRLRWNHRPCKTNYLSCGPIGYLFFGKYGMSITPLLHDCRCSREELRAPILEESMPLRKSRSAQKIWEAVGKEEDRFGDHLWKGRVVGASDLHRASRRRSLRRHHAHR